MKYLAIALLLTFTACSFEVESKPSSHHEDTSQQQQQETAPAQEQEAQPAQPAEPEEVEVEYFLIDNDRITCAESKIETCGAILTNCSNHRNYYCVSNLKSETVTEKKKAD